MLVVRPIRDISLAPRWLLISGSVPYLGVSLGTSRSGRSLVADGNSGVVDGVGDSTIQIQTTSI